MSGPGAQRFETVKKAARIEIIPLIDVIFFLLATFVLFTLSLEKIKSLPVELPTASTAQQLQQEDDSVTIQVSDGNNVYWNRELISISAVEGRIEAYKKQVQTPRILIAGDDQAQFGTAVQVFDKVRAAGITQVSVETQTRVTGK
jgi:biopolymer transport protein ExbD